jgi:hypothetical protein
VSVATDPAMKSRRFVAIEYPLRDDVFVEARITMQPRRD